MQKILKAIILCIALLILCSPSFANKNANANILVQDNSAFAMDIYHKLSTSNKNIFFSPYSISTALAMTYGGARRNTEKEMKKTLRFSLAQKYLHPAFAQIESKLNKIQKSGKIELSMANSLWPQQDYKFLDKYLSLVKNNYGVAITPVDYKYAREDARNMINKWVEDKTQNKIKNIILPNVLDAETRLVLVNAIYFKGDWKNKFRSKKTRDAPFYLSSKKPIQVPMMHQIKRLKYADLGSLQMLELPYAGNEMSMIVLLPKKTTELKQLEKNLSAENLAQWKIRLRTKKVRLFLPKFKMTSMFELKKTLKSMGMVAAFDELSADFSGMDGSSKKSLQRQRLYIGDVIHKAFVDVNETGAEAAAATAVLTRVRTSSISNTPPPPPVIFRADHSFVFLIQDNQTGSILFMGRITDPTKT